MKRYKKREILDVIASLGQINQMLMRNFNFGRPVSGSVLEECQESAITVGNILETYGEQGERIVRILEDYCENIYQMSLAGADGEKAGKLAKDIKKQLDEVRDQIKNSLPEDKKEIVFLPYKASMWDSLESVWKDAAGDHGCDTYVIPIPYFDKNPDGALGQMHYEGDLYPSYVPVTSWQEYSIPERRPDVVYIHNPYDQCNYVTSVHPDYYAANLRKYTNMLVYIPYFVAINDNVEKHFCVTPGVLYAHKVIVQSKKVRQTYIDELHKYERENNCRGAFGKIRDKIVVQESPKYVKARTFQKEEYPLPEEWEKLITGKNGSRKKVIFYNTTITAMLLHGDDMILKIKRVLEIFKEQENVVLLWRPHPLLKVTLQSMRPELLAKYEQMEKEYKKEGWGIYDESPDLYRAIAWSDAYYGDSSSVVELYKQTKKPVMIQNVEV